MATKKTKVPRKYVLTRKDGTRIQVDFIMDHGTLNGYTNQGCRCTQCKTANADYQAQYRARRFLDKKGRSKLCSIPKCPRVASKATGNGLCYAHHLEAKHAAA